MGKAAFQLLGIVLLFFAVWFGLSQVNYMKIFHLKGINKKTEKKIGEFIMKSLDTQTDKVDDDSARILLKKITQRICIGSPLHGDSIHVYLIRSSEINAFALPGNNLIVYTGLLKHCDSVSELCGVMAHEIGHISLDHVMKRLGSEIGITVLASLAAQGNTEIVTRIIKMLSTSAFERKQEAEADEFAVRCLLLAKINPDGFANFMNKIAKMQSNIPEAFEWISSHPDSKSRVEAIRKLAGNSYENGLPVLTDEEWNTLKTAANNAD